LASKSTHLFDEDFENATIEFEVETGHRGIS
jgi:hypothetical protein